MAWVGAVVGVVSTVLSVAGQRQQAKASIAKGEFDRAVKLRQAKDVRTAAQQEGFEEKRRASLLKSRALAIAAASGSAGRSVDKIMGEIDSEGAYRQALAVYEGEASARYLEAGGQAAYVAGRSRARAYETLAASEAVRGGASMYEKYGAQGAQ